MTISRTHDMELVARIMGHPSIFRHIAEDGIERPDPVDHPGFHWMLITRKLETVGVFLVHAQSMVCYEMHTMIFPAFWGDTASEAAQELARWVFMETDCEKLVTRVPAYNRAALRFAIANGMQQEGINRASYLRGGKLIDQVNLGITKKEWICQQ